MIGNSPYKEDIARLFREGLELERLHGKTILVAGATSSISLVSPPCRASCS